MIGFQWDFKQKWPITRAERLRELGILSIHYETTLQRQHHRSKSLACPVPAGADCSR
jgi:hypothetical protein